MSVLIVVAYALGWLLTAAFAMRWLADNWGYCRRGNPTYLCRGIHGDDCIQPDGRVVPRHIAAGCGAALLWPLLLAPGAACWLATRKPTPLRQARRIEELERQLGMEERR